MKNNDYMKKAGAVLGLCAFVGILTGCESTYSDTISEVTATGSSVISQMATAGSSVISESADIGSSIISEVTDAADESDYAQAAKSGMDELLELMQSKETDESGEASSENDGILSSTADINLRDIDGFGKNYEFDYAGETFSCIYTTDNWKLKNSYKIENYNDMLIICQALIDTNPVHGRDLVSYRTAEDMAYEWLEHNLAYYMLSSDDPMLSHARDVDFDPDDQNKTVQEFYEEITGKEFNIKDFLGSN
ncbi:MAG: hypothetical protein K6A23_03080 [Butyrivibrio sp.]|nr:hypothetical protein [Butyrivibrio sp.]